MSEQNQEIKPQYFCDALNQQLTFNCVILYLEAAKSICVHGVNIDFTGLYHKPKVLIVESFGYTEEHWYMGCREVGTDYNYTFHGENDVPDSRFYKIADSVYEYLKRVFDHQTAVCPGA
jgi:hypothetical protein